MDPGRSYMDNLQVAVLDENRVVTYKWLGAFLSSPSNEAKKMLFSFAKTNAGKVQATYLVAGMQEDGSYAVTLASAEKLEETKKALARVATVHVYSVQKQLPKDANLIAAPARQQELDLFASLQQDPSKMLVRPSLSAIRCADATRRSLEPRRAAQQQQQQQQPATGKRKAPAAKAEAPAKKSAKKADEKAGEKAGEKEATKASEEKAAQAPQKGSSKKAPAKKSSGLGSFFDKQRATAKAKPKAAEKSAAAEKGVKQETNAKRKEEKAAVAGKKRPREEPPAEAAVKEEKKGRGVDIGAFWAKKAPGRVKDISQEVLPSQPRKRLKRKSAKAAKEDDSIFEDDDEKPLLQDSDEEAHVKEERKEESHEESGDEAGDVVMEEAALDESMGSPSLLDSSEGEKTAPSQEEPPVPERGALDKFMARSPKKSGPTEVVKVHSSPGPSPGRVKVTKRKLVDGYYQFVDEWETVEGSGSEAVEAKEQKAKEESSQKEKREAAAKALSKASGQASLTSFFKKK